MKTKTFSLLRFISHIADSLTIVASSIFIIYILINTQILNLETLIMVEYTFTIQFVSKMLFFMNMLISFMSFYSLNLASKFMMKITAFFSVFTILFGSFTIYYLKSDYHQMLSNILNDKFYSKSKINIQILNLYPSSPPSKVIDLYLSNIERIMNLTLLFEVLSLTMMMVTFIVLIVAQNIKISLEEVKIPPIKEMSRVGLNTCSLRTKRIVEVTV